ncbi:MAG: FtsX-like permease family protein [Oscillospiraceae bacterium]|nr:FtsX-like permease family protein [Oscillospiraceae bacterium]
MSIVQSFRLAIKSLAASKMRALLTMLGIIIGVAAVIIIISLGDGMNNMINSEFEKMGTNLLQVQVLGRGTSRSVSDSEMYDLAGAYPQYISAMSPSVPVRASLKTGGEVSSSTSITGVGEDYITVKALELDQGRFLQYIDVARMQKVCVVGSYVDGELMGGTSLGQKVRIGGQEYSVVGVLKEQADNTSYGNDNAVYIPYTNATRLNGDASITNFQFTASSDQTNSQAKAVIEEKLNRVYENDSDAFMVISMSEMMGVLGNIQGTVMTVLIAIAGISLLVGGIGIMNIMLVSVTERTREIGIRKSLGAKRRDIRSQFIIEAGTTSAVGGVIGIVMGVGIANLVGPLFDIEASPSVSAILIAFGVSLAVGVIFGYLPANKAAKLNSIDALRYD